LGLSPELRTTPLPASHVKGEDGSYGHGPVTAPTVSSTASPIDQSTQIRATSCRTIALPVPGDPSALGLFGALADGAHPHDPPARDAVLPPGAAGPALGGQDHAQAGQLARAPGA